MYCTHILQYDNILRFNRILSRDVRMAVSTGQCTDEFGSRVTTILLYVRQSRGRWSNRRSGTRIQSRKSEYYTQWRSQVYEILGEGSR